jgi:hypothetical protein
MPELHRIEIKGGKVSVTVTGVKGQACKAATERLQGLGKTITDTDLPELYEAGNEAENVTAGR